MTDDDRPAATQADLAAIRDRWVGVEFDVATFEIDPARMVAWAESCGDTDPRFIDPSNPDFQAYPNFTAQLTTHRVLPDDFPKIGPGFGIDGGKSVECLAPIRVGDTLTGTATIADIFDKTGRSGTMVFIVQRMTYHNQRGEHVSTVDWKMIRQL